MLSGKLGLRAAVHPQARVVVVDDEQPNLELMGRVLERIGYENVELTRDPLAMLATIATTPPDLIILDLHMPGIDGFEVLRRLQRLVPADVFLPKLVITADATEGVRRRAMWLGAEDFLTKPIDVTDTSMRVMNLLAGRMMHKLLKDHNQRLEDQVRARTRQLEESHRALATRLALVGEYRDDQTSQHTIRVGKAAHRLATAFGYTQAEADLIGDAAPLHDIGKIAIPDSILLKAGPLDPAEFEIIKTHAAVGAHILAGGESELLRLAEQIAYTHHERWDGSGYPRGLRRQDIPLAGRLVAVVDVFDALVSVRPYKKSWSVERTVEHMRRQRGRHFDPDVIDVYLHQLDTAAAPLPELATR